MMEVRHHFDLKGYNTFGIQATAEYFAELFRVSQNQIIWGGNYFGLPATRCYLVWDKGEGFYNRTYAECELAWTSLDKNTAKIKHDPNHSKEEHEPSRHVKHHRRQKPQGTCNKAAAQVERKMG